MLNVVVEESLRGNGVGTALMAAATDMAVQQWHAERMYTHVDCQNEARTELMSTAVQCIQVAKSALLCPMQLFSEIHYQEHNARAGRV